MRKYLRHLPSYLAGAISTLLVISLTVTALAVSGKVQFGGTNLSVLGTKVSATEHFTGENGAKIPATISYIDDLGGTTTFVPLRKFSRLLDASVVWDGKSRTAHFGEGTNMADPDIQTGLDTVNTSATVSTPQLGVKAGPFTEVALRDATEKGRATVLLETARFDSLTGFLNQRYYVFPEYGNYVEIEVTNHGEPVGMLVSRPQFVSNGSVYEPFSNVKLEKGQTITRAFEMDAGAEFVQSFLRLDVEGIFDGNYHNTDITVKVTQYAK